MTGEERGTAAAWEAVFRRSYPSVYRALVAVLLNSDLAQDALQDAFAEGLRRPPPSDHALAGWLFRVALRRARRIRGFGLPLRLDELIGSLREPDISAETEALLDRLQVGDLLRLLTRRQRAVVVAHYYLGLTQQEIADALGVRRGTVGATLSQALQHMRRGGSHVV
ncbi:MAG TPA: RNA polymerase sigma factor [Candidatus Limnocylindria bacterium]|nr:RNA polymerase sigma factor [Candidatus Limnocylindria bacterium]